jgi:hypothetical protein
MPVATKPDPGQNRTLFTPSLRDPAWTFQESLGVLAGVEVPLDPPAAVRQIKHVNRLIVRGGPSYPLRRSFGVIVFQGDRIAEATIRELESVVMLQGRGKSESDALANLAHQFHRLVEEHWHVPPHDQTDEDRRINRVLAHMVNWEEYEAENPVEEPFWGRIDRVLDDGSRQVYWYLGPRGAHGTKELLPGLSGFHELGELREGDWFYGAGKVISNQLIWTVAPVRAPDPHDPEAVREAWDLIPAKVMSDAAAWPLRQSE